MTAFSDEYVLGLEKQVEKMKEDCNLLYALQGCGVDSWQGYDDALQMLEDRPEGVFLD